MLASRQSKPADLTTGEPDATGTVGEDATRVPAPQTKRYAHGSSCPQRTAFEAGPFWPSECSVMSATWSPSPPHESAWAIGAAIATAAAAEAIIRRRRQIGRTSVTLVSIPGG